MTLTLSASTSSGPPPSVDLVVTATTTDLEGALTLTRIHADGSRHRVLTEADPHLASGLWGGTDPHMPFNQPITYEAQVGAQVATAVIAVMSSVTWLVPPGVVELAARARVFTEISDISFPSAAGRFDVLDGLPIAVAPDPASVPPASGKVTLYAESAGDRESLVTLLRRQGPLLISTPGAPGWDLRWMWVLLPEGFSLSSPPRMDRGMHPDRFVSFSFTQVEDPDVDLTPLWTDEDMEAAFATDANAEAAYANAFDAERNRRL